MKHDWLKLISGAALAATLAGGTTVYAEETDFGAWDTDISGDLSYEEWDAGYEDEGLYSQWDENEDEELSEDEYGRGIFNGYDEDDDDAVNEEEYQLYEDDADEGFWDV